MRAFARSLIHLFLVCFTPPREQGNENARKKGIGVVMRRDGSIIRRGLGQPDWREVRTVFVTRVRDEP